MSGVELIVAALAAGSGTGVTDPRSTAVRDAHAGLKNLLCRHLAGHDQALAALRAEEAHPGVWRSWIGDELDASGAATDRDVLAAARRLLALLGDGAIKYWVDVRRSRSATAGGPDQRTYP